MLFGYQLPELKNIINLFNWKKLLSTKEKDDIELSMGNLIDNFIESDILGFSNPNFEFNMKEYVIQNTFILLKEVYTYTIKDKEKIIEIEKELEEEMELIYNKIHKIYFTKYYPIRSYDNTFIRIEPNIDKISNKIKYIENKPQPDQRTNEWYMFRHDLITASSAWKVFKSQSTINQLVVEKCKEIDVSKYDYVNTATPMHHGNKYEEVSIMLYEYMYNTKVKDYGCIQHDTYKFLGASPDGINVDPTSSRFGRMLEIKNPTSREITGIPKEDYWIQMQLQMETCNLNECDFLETVFKEYDGEEEFMADGSFTYNEEDQLKGMMIYFIKDGKPLYEYMPLQISKEEYTDWYETTMETHADLTWIKDIFWRLEDYSCILVLRNKLWFESAISKIENVWAIIETERRSGCDHRHPKKQTRACRSRSTSGIEDANSLLNNTLGCLINIDDL